MKKTLRIFLADDDIDDVDLFGHTLQQIDPAILFVAASNGLEALRSLDQQEAPDLLFFDLNMPMTDGRKCLQAIKQSEKLKDIPAIMFTTSSFPTDVSDCLALGAICFITKPTDIVELEQILRTIIDHVDGDIVGALRGLKTDAGIYY